MSFHVGCTHARTYARMHAGTRVTSWLHACFPSTCHSIEFPIVTSTILPWNPIAVHEHVHFSKYQESGRRYLPWETSLDIGGRKRWKVDALSQKGIHNRLLLIHKSCWNFYLNASFGRNIFREEEECLKENEFWGWNVKKIKNTWKKGDKWYLGSLKRIT